MTRSTTLFGTFILSAASLCAAGLISTSVRADEGMWTYDHPPLKQLEDRYGFKPDQAWFDHLRLSSVEPGASASFVSPDGLVITNHHVTLGYVQRLSSPEHNYVRDGFYAKTQAEELPMPGATLAVVVSLEDVTDKVNATVKAGATPAQAQEQREKAMAAIAADCLKTTGFKGDVVPLFGGSKRVLYRFKEYTDVRLVFTPELAAAFFGGDDDNFTYPRYDLDMSFIRAYENGKPAKVQHYLHVNPKGAADGDLVFVSGNPGRTERLLTYSMLMYQRDQVYPHMIERLKARRELLKAYGQHGPEQARRARTYLYFIENSVKAREGEFRGLNDPALMKKKLDEETALRAAIAKNPALAPYAKAWADLEQAEVWARDHQKDIRFKTAMGERGLLGSAIQMVRYAKEAPKPDSERLAGFHEAEIRDVLRHLTTPSPSYKDLELVLLTDEVKVVAAGLGPDDPYVKTMLAGKTPEALVNEVVEGTKLDDAAFRRELLKDKGKAVLTSRDPMIQLALRLEPTLRETRRLVRENVDAVETEGLTQVAKAQFAVYGDSVYPDATGTLRLAFGKVAGYPFATTLVPPFTTFYGLYDRAYGFGQKGDFAIPPRTAARRDKLDLSTPLNLVCTADITGGNSGSPLVDREGRLVGLVFDGNMQSHPNTFVYEETQARCVAVDIRGILEALRKLYDAGPLADEMLAGAK